MTDTHDPATQPLLRCLDGKPAPAELAASLGCVGELPAGSHESFAELLLSTLGPLPEDQLDNRIGRICRRHDLPLETTARAVKSVRFVLRAAASMNLAADGLGGDLTALGLGADGSARVLGLYDQALPELRQEIVQATILAHGKVLAGLEWRIDTLGASNRGRAIHLPVALITFHCLEGDQASRFTLQLTPDMVKELRDVCDYLLKR